MIRKAQLKDVRKILSVIKNTPELQSSTEGEGVYSEDYVRNCIEDKKMSLVLVAEENKKFAGVLNAEIWKNKKYSFLVDMAVLPDYRGRGLGTKLYNQYEKYCKKQGLKIIIALVQETNKKMQGFCDKRGLKKGFKFYCYEKEI